jgi:hypothetical protein
MANVESAYDQKIGAGALTTAWRGLLRRNLDFDRHSGVPRSFELRESDRALEQIATVRQINSD